MKPTTDLGTNEIHKRHKVMIEGGKIPKAKVMDQLVIDRYLIDGLLTLVQHRAAEYIFHQAIRAGMYTQPLNYGDRARGATDEGERAEAVVRYGKTMKIITQKLGEYVGHIVEEVVLHNWDVAGDANRMEALRNGLELIVERRMAGGRNPMRHLDK
jgi:hypothetical protein